MKILLDAWRAWIADFDQTVEDDHWDRLEPYLADNVRYIVSGAPFSCSIEGRAAVLAGLRKSVQNFDHKFIKRTWHPVGVQTYEPGYVTARILSGYDKAGAPPLRFPATCHWHFLDGKIDLMLDFYDAEFVEIDETFAWLERYAPEADPSYV
ncbi:MAG: nuclear transport factor 2 family protein [Rhodobiaceae bacterium]|nr:nuclear transport factor 2 family protein [Rhodobiaceae bacterium]